jgi:peptidoglycan-N-acetylglucosamine deacetylase
VTDKANRGKLENGINVYSRTHDVLAEAYLDKGKSVPEHLAIIQLKGISMNLRTVGIWTVLLLTVISNRALTQQIALTFDDAPTADGPLFTGVERTDRVLRHLQSKQSAQAAFFVITSQINAETTSRLEKYVQAGHLLANHTHSHRWIADIGAKAYCLDVLKADSILAGFKGYSKLFRYPFLDEGKTKHLRDTIRSLLASAKLMNGYVTIDNYDWYLHQLLRKAKAANKEVDLEVLKAIYLEHVWNSIEFYDHVALKAMGRSPKHVLLLHENDLTALYLGDLIDFIRSKGWKIIGVNEAYSDPIASQLPDVLFNGQGRVAAIANEKGMKPAELVQQSEDEIYLDNLVRERKVFK